MRSRLRILAQIALNEQLLDLAILPLAWCSALLLLALSELIPDAAGIRVLVVWDLLKSQLTTRIFLNPPVRKSPAFVRSAESRHQAGAVRSLSAAFAAHHLTALRQEAAAAHHHRVADVL